MSKSSFLIAICVDLSRHLDPVQKIRKNVKRKHNELKELGWYSICNIVFYISYSFQFLTFLKHYILYFEILKISRHTYMWTNIDAIIKN
jgi:hypothetical protein